MDSENVQVLRRLEDLFNGRDLDTYLQLIDPGVEWRVSEEDPDTAVKAECRSTNGWLSRSRSAKDA